MNTCFGLFSIYNDASEAVDALVLSGAPEDSINVIANERVTRIIQENLLETNMGKTNDEGGATTAVLDSLLWEQNGVEIPDAGRLVAAGKVAGSMVQHSSGLNTADGSLGAKLAEIGIPPEEVRRICTSLRNNGILIWTMCTENLNPAPSAIFASHNARIFGIFALHNMS